MILHQVWKKHIHLDLDGRLLNDLLTEKKVIIRLICAQNVCVCVFFLYPRFRKGKFSYRTTSQINRYTNCYFLTEETFEFIREQIIFKINANWEIAIRLIAKAISFDVIQTSTFSFKWFYHVKTSPGISPKKRENHPKSVICCRKKTSMLLHSNYSV